MEEKRKGAGRLIRYVRATTGFDQEQFAEACGVSKTAVNGWETYRFAPNAEHRALIVAAAVFHGNTSDIFAARCELADDLAAACAEFGETYKCRREVERIS